MMADAEKLLRGSQIDTDSSKDSSLQTSVRETPMNGSAPGSCTAGCANEVSIAERREEMQDLRQTGSSPSLDNPADGLNA